MFSPTKVNGDFLKKITSLYVSSGDLNAGSLVDLDLTDTVSVSGSVGFTTMRAGSVIAATVTNTNAFPRELGLVIPDVQGSGIPFEERILGMAESYMTIPVGYAVAIFKPSGGDVIASDQFVGNLAGDTGAPGFLDVTNPVNYGKAVGVFQGRFRLVQAGDVVRARYVGNTTVGGVNAPMFEFAS
jgi:hypothetical protein